MVDPLSIFVNSIIGSIYKYLAERIKKLNDDGKNKRIFRNWIDYYKKEAERKKH